MSPLEPCLTCKTRDFKIMPQPPRAKGNQSISPVFILEKNTHMIRLFTCFFVFFVFKECFILYGFGQKVHSGFSTRC